MAHCSCAVFLVAVAVSSLFHTGYGLQCWSCSSDADPDCADPFNPSHKVMTECKANNKGEIATCEAIVLKVNTLEVITMRDCGSVPMNKPLNISCELKLPAHSSIEWCDVCIKDGCNTATVQRATYWAALVSVLVIFLNDLLKCHF